MTCPVCGMKCFRSLLWPRSGANYIQCNVFEPGPRSGAGCGTIYTTDVVVPETENDNPKGRNHKSQHLIRFRRVESESSTEGIQDVLDFGCGDGEFVNYLKFLGCNAYGIDTDTAGQLDDIPEDFVDAVFMIEVIEHLTGPQQILKELTSKLYEGGVIYIETTFAEQISDPSTHPYVDPRIGHRTIVSRKGLGIMAAAAGLEIAKDVNPNVVILRKR